MPVEQMTYKQLDNVLGQLGFSRRRVEPKWLRYEHADSDTMIALVEKEPNELVRATDAVSARRHLVEKGFVTDAELDTMLLEGARARSTLKK
jgi:hypothetical protein